MMHYCYCHCRFQLHCSQGFAKYIPLSVLMIFLTMNPVFGGIVGNATAATEGTFCAVLNIFVLRGFFPDGVILGDGFLSSASTVGWIDVMLFNTSSSFPWTCVSVSNSS